MEREAANDSGSESEAFVTAAEPRQANNALPQSTTIPLPRSGSLLSVPQAEPGQRRRQSSQTPLFPNPGRRKSLRTSKVGWRDVQDASFTNGRVLLIDYVRSSDIISGGKTKISTSEFHSVKALEKYYRDHGTSREAALRVVHVQNAQWATDFFLKRFNISKKNDLVGTSFGRYVKNPEPELHAGKPFLKGRVWNVQRDPWRGIRRMAFSLDYQKLYTAGTFRHGSSSTSRMMEINHYTDDGTPAYGFSVYGQRVSVYLQHFDSDSKTPPDDVPNPYRAQNINSNGTATARPNRRTSLQQNLPDLDSLDNGSTVIVFEKSATDSVRDTLLTARDQIESRWRRLTFFLPRDDFTSDERLALRGIDHIVGDIFRGLSFNWDQFLTTTETHVSILEDKIYEAPADETRAPELWANANMWLRCEKLANIHLNIAKELRSKLSDMTENSDDQPDTWLDGIPEEMENVVNFVQEDLVKPTQNLNELLYKSVEIRDSRHSLQLNTSLWRLSWITFIFLPLTFMVGFFGMNVSTFQGDVAGNLPSIKYYFIAAVVLMSLVLVLWYMVKHSLASQHRTPYQRGIYEHMYHDLAMSHPNLWTRGGPIENVRPAGFFDRLRWRLLLRWFDPKHTVNLKPSDPDEDAGGSDLGTWARVKRLLARRWVRTIKIDAEATPSMIEMGTPEHVEDNGGAIHRLVNSTTITGTAAASPTDTAAAARQTIPSAIQRQYPHVFPESRTDPEGAPTRPSSSGSSGMIVEERDFDDVEPEDAPWARRWRRSIDAVIGGLDQGDDAVG